MLHHVLPHVHVLRAQVEHADNVGATRGLALNDTVRLCGLLHSSSMNGTTGTIIAPLTASGQWPVKLNDAPGTTGLFNSNNLTHHSRAQIGARLGPIPVHDNEPGQVNCGL